MSLDLEGAEMLVLELIDFNQIIFGIMYIKANEQKPLMKNLAMTVLLEDKGYSFMLEYQGSNNILMAISMQFAGILSTRPRTRKILSLEQSWET